MMHDSGVCNAYHALLGASQPLPPVAEGAVVVNEESAAALVGYVVWATHFVFAIGLAWGRIVGHAVTTI